MSNRSLNQAQANKNDEFYTRLEDIERELRHYKNHFKDRIVFCNCDDPFESNFVKYFALNFNHLGLKKLIATCYATSPVAWGQLSLFDINTFEEPLRSDKLPYKIEITEVMDFNEDGATDILDIEYLLKNNKNTLTILKGDGDFRSIESIELLKESDIVVTNPPFSLFGEYLAQLTKYQKKFLILGNLNAVTTKEIFPLFKNNEMWLGVSRIGTGSMWFMIPEDFPIKSGQKIQDGVRYQTIGSTMWATNLDHQKRHDELILWKSYNSEEYPTYDNYNAIEVSKVAQIPVDYAGVMGVPITFLGKYNPNQFKIIGSDYQVKEGLLDTLINENWSGKLDRAYVNGKRKYGRIFIQNKKVEN